MSRTADKLEQLANAVEAAEHSLRALVLIHVDSLAAYADEVSQFDARALRDGMVDAISAMEDGTLVVVVHQGWETHYAEKIIAAAKRHEPHVIMQFDEDTQPWSGFFRRLKKVLTTYGVSEVLLGGCWWDPSRSQGRGRGCATHTYHWLQRQGYNVEPQDHLLAADPYLDGNDNDNDNDKP